MSLFFRVIKVAKQFTGDSVHFAVSDGDDMRQELEALGLSDKEPTAGIYDSKGKYSMSKDFSVDSLKEFVQDYLDRKLEPHIKLETVPILIILDPLSKNEFTHACNENY